MNASEEKSGEDWVRGLFSYPPPDTSEMSPEDASKAIERYTDQVLKADRMKKGIGSLPPDVAAPLRRI